jgi:hypothetical protein
MAVMVLLGSSPGHRALFSAADRVTEQTVPR